MRVIATLLLVFGILVGLFVYSSETNPESRFPFRLGLDLSGGTLLTYKADTSALAPEEVEESMASLRDVIERRVNIFGVSEPLVQTERSSSFTGIEEERLIVELPGVTDVEEAVRQLGETPVLDFRLLDRTALAALENAGTTTLSGSLDELYIPTGLTGRFLERASLQFSQGGGHSAGLATSPVIALDFTSEGSDLFAEITRENVGEILAIFLDGTPISEPVIQTEIPDGTAVITGNFTPEEARDLVRDLNFGALPVPIELISTQTVGGALGAEVLGGGVKAGIWGLVLVSLFLILWYRLPGVLAAVSLLIYGVVMLALFKLIPVTLTAAGIAGFILSVGMAVDANILIFERLKEELRAGKDLENAIREGFMRAWASIRDGNLSTLITAVILFWFGTSVVEGFALTLGIGVLVSMLTAISVTRTFLIAVAPKKKSVLFGSGFQR